MSGACSEFFKYPSRYNSPCLNNCLLLFIMLFLGVSSHAQAAAASQQYKLGSGDKVRIQVYNEDDLYLETIVSDRGTISYPFLGELKVAGLTPAQLEAEITTKLKGDYLVNPKVSVDILEYRPFYVNGEVQKPGGFPFQPGITIRKAISVAGGFTERASKDKIFIIRGDDPAGKSVKIGLDDQIFPGDIVTVEQSFF